MGGVQRLAFNANKCGEARHRLQRICTPAPPYPCGHYVGGPYGRRSAPGIPRQTNVGGAPEIHCTPAPSAPLPPTVGDPRGGNTGSARRPPASQQLVGGPYGRRSAPGIPRQTNAGRGPPAHTPASRHAGPSHPYSSWGALMGGVQRLAFHAKQMREGTTGTIHLPLTSLPRWDALTGGVQRLAFNANQRGKARHCTTCAPRAAHSTLRPTPQWGSIFPYPTCRWGPPRGGTAGGAACPRISGKHVQLPNPPPGGEAYPLTPRAGGDTTRGISRRTSILPCPIGKHRA